MKGTAFLKSGFGGVSGRYAAGSQAINLLCPIGSSQFHGFGKGLVRKVFGSTGLKKPVSFDTGCMKKPALFPGQRAAHPVTHQPVLEILALVDLDGSHDTVYHGSCRQQRQDGCQDGCERDEHDPDQDG